MSTVPVLQLCMEDVTVIRGRRFHVSRLPCCWYCMRDHISHSGLHLAWQASSVLPGHLHASPGYGRR